MNEKPKFTPGPYRCEGPDPFGDWNILHPSDALAVAAVVSNMREPEEVAANARLFSAAPELYEALEMVRDGDDDCRKDGLPTMSEFARGRIDAALAKAEGRS